MRSVKLRGPLQPVETLMISKVVENDVYCLTFHQDDKVLWFAMCVSQEGARREESISRMPKFSERRLEHEASTCATKNKSVPFCCAIRSIIHMCQLLCRNAALPPRGDI